MTARYPVLLDLAGKPCLVVGGGSVATRKVLGLLGVDAHVTVLAPDASPELVDAADTGRVTWLCQAYAPGDAGRVPDADRPWSFVVAATDQPALNAAVVADAEAAGTWANDATDRAGGPASLPAVHRQGPITVAVATGGANPGAAAWLRDQVGAVVGPEHATALALCDEVAGRDQGHPRPNWRLVVESGMLDLIREGRTAEAKERLQACLSSSSD